MPSKINPIFIDTDLDFDDYLAILFLLGNANVQIKGISVSGCGAVYRQNGINYLRKLLDILGKKDIPVFAGAKTPLKYSNQFPLKIRKNANLAYNINELLYDSIHYEAKDALEGLKDISHSSKVDLILLAGASTIGAYIQKGHKIDNIDNAYFSGGNVLTQYLPTYLKQYGTQGNIIKSFGTSESIYSNKVAEYNVFVDVYAAQLLLQSKIKNTFITLNATSKGFSIYDGLIQSIREIKTKGANMAVQILNLIRATQVNAFGLPIFDLIAAFVATNPCAVQECIEQKIYIKQDISLQGDDECGKFITSTKGNQCKLILKVDKSLTKEAFLESLKVL